MTQEVAGFGFQGKPFHEGMQAPFHLCGYGLHVWTVRLRLEPPRT